MQTFIWEKLTKNPETRPTWILISEQTGVWGLIEYCPSVVPSWRAVDLTDLRKEFFCDSFKSAAEELMGFRYIGLPADFINPEATNE